MEKITVLIADDMEIMANFLKKELEKIENIEVIGIVTDGKEELEKILELKPNFVFTDNRMPFLNGIDVIEKIKEENLDTKFILITGDRDFSIFQKANELGVIKILTKPIDYSKISEIVAEIL